MRSYTQTDRQTDKETDKQANRQTCMHARMKSRIRACVRTYRYPNIHAELRCAKVGGRQTRKNSWHSAVVSAASF